MGGISSTAAGRGLGLVFRALKLVRPGRPIHPSGVRLVGTLERFPPSEPSGIGWIDKGGTDHVCGRFSRSIGLPSMFPDILGLALRLGGPGGTSDILLASTGAAVPGRFLLVPLFSATAATLGSLMPYRGTRGPILLAARTVVPGSGQNLPGIQEPAGRLPADPAGFRKALLDKTWVLQLGWARPAGRWIPFGTLTLTLDPLQDDAGLRFDPLHHELPDAGTYGWARRLREPSYSTARQ
jgi:hypothetical protein